MWTLPSILARLRSLLLVACVLVHVAAGVDTDTDPDSCASAAATTTATPPSALRVPIHDTTAIAASLRERGFCILTNLTLEDKDSWSNVALSLPERVFGEGGDRRLLSAGNHGALVWFVVCSVTAPAGGVQFKRPRSARTTLSFHLRNRRTVQPTHT